MKSPTFSKKAWMIVSTLLVIVAIFIYYFAVYVKQQESMLIRDSLRVLTQIRDNYYDLEDGYYTNAVIASEGSGEINPIIVKANTPGVTFGSESVMLGPDKLWMHLDREGLAGLYTGIFSWVSVPNKEPYYYYIELEDIFSQEIMSRHDLFDFIAIHTDSLTLYTNNPLGDVHFKHEVADSVSFYRQDLGYDDYFVFSTKLKESQGVFLSGYINQNAFNGKKREVPLPMLILSSIAVILVILCLPLVKLKVMSNLERLYISDVLFSGISIVFIPAIFMVFAIGFLFQFHYSKLEVRAELRDLSGQIERSFEAELQAMMTQLDAIKAVTQTKEVPKADTLLADSTGADSVVVAETAEAPGTLPQLQTELLKVLPKKNLYTPAGAEEFAFRKINTDPFFEHYNLFNAIFWANDKGESKAMLTLKENTVLKLPLDHRAYVRNVYEDKLITFKGKDNKEYKLAMESIRSVNDGSFELGVGVESGIAELPVLAISGPIRSVMQPIVRKGYGFCVIDNAGNTVFHSDIFKNLNENFLEETDGSIREYLRSQTQHFQQVKYGGKSQYILSKPLGCLEDLNLVTFVDKQFVHTKTTISLYTTLSLYFIFLIVLSILYGIIYGLTYRGTKLKQRVFPFNWVRPYDTVRHHFLYKYLAYFNALTMFYLVATTMLFEQEGAFLINSLLLISFLSMASNYHLLSNSLPNEKRLFTIYNTDTRKSYLPLYVFVGCVLVGILGFRVRYMLQSPVLFLWDAIMLVFFGLFLLLGKRCRKKTLYRPLQIAISAVYKAIQKHPVVFKSYKAYLVTWVLMLSMIPILILFRITYLKESEIYFKQHAFDYNGARTQWEADKMKPYADLLADPETKDYMDSVLNTELEGVQYDYGGLRYMPTDSLCKVPTKAFDSLYAKLRLPLNEYGHSTSGFVLNDHVNWAYVPSDSSGVLCLDYPAAYLVSSTPTTRSLLDFRAIFVDLTLILLVAIGMMVVIVAIMIFAIHRVYGLNFKSDYRLLSFDGPERFRQFFLGKTKDTQDEDAPEPDGLPEPETSIVGRLLGLAGDRGDVTNSFNNTLLVGVNASHISVIKKGLQQFEKANCTVLIMDMYDLKLQADHDDPAGVEVENVMNRDDIERLLTAKNGDRGDITSLLDALFTTDSGIEKYVVFIEHFEFAFNDHRLNKERLKLLERLVDHERVAVTLSSEINPTNIYEYYEHEIQRLEAHLKTKTDSSEEWLKVRDALHNFQIDYRKWLNLLGSFTKITLPLQIQPSPEGEARTADNPYTLKNLLEPREVDIRDQETRNGNYLSHLRLYFDDVVKDNRKGSTKGDSEYIAPEDYIMKVQEVSYAYYFSIWNSLSKEERYIVYDIAKDKFVNTNNTDGINDLLNKGILVYDHSLRLMNESFANFILSKVNSDEALEKELENRKAGSWSKASAILVLIIVALIVFISFGQLSILDDLNTLIGSLAAMFTLFLRVGGFGLKKG